MVQNILFSFISLFIAIKFGYSSGTSVICANGLGSVDTSKLCDFVADCNDASDELNFGLCKMLAKYKDCSEKSQIKCDSRGRRGNYNSVWSNQCTDIITACNLEENCFSSSADQLCNEVRNGRLRTPKFTETSKLEKNKTEENPNFPEMMKVFGEAMNETMKRNFSECPPLFTPFGDTDKCIFLFTPIKVSWFEAQMFCKLMTASLVILNDMDSYFQLVDYIQQKEIKSRFWIGAKYGALNNGNCSKSEKTWTWLNGDPVKMGVPFWSLYTVGVTMSNKQCQDNERKMMPRITGDEETCLSIMKENFYYFSDEFCTARLSPLCMTDKVQITFLDNVLTTPPN